MGKLTLEPAIDMFGGGDGMLLLCAEALARGPIRGRDRSVIAV